MTRSVESATPQIYTQANQLSFPYRSGTLSGPYRDLIGTL
jgi:hypothetical protein